MTEQSPVPQGSSPTARRLMHTRDIRCSGYLRDDGLWDIVGQLTDTKTYTEAGLDTHPRAAGDPIHSMSLTLTIDGDYVIQNAVATMGNVPQPQCMAVPDAYAKLVGLKIGPGFNAAVKERVGGVLGCSHLTHLLTPMAATAIQTVWPWTRLQHVGNDTQWAMDAKDVAGVIDGCMTLRSDGDVVRRSWPEHYTGPAEV